ncbi:MAG TPA: hypothetical protein DCY13_10545, partial [Verrucomicrobiales bacterium]|nr:hypothetical protein [Verrucomicrobiales bacterium]
MRGDEWLDAPRLWRFPPQPVLSVGLTAPGTLPRVHHYRPVLPRADLSRARGGQGYEPVKMLQTLIPPCFLRLVLRIFSAPAGASVTARLVGLLFVISGAIPSLRAEQVVIGEIMYHPPGTRPAWVEIENLTASPFDIADWTLTGSELRFRFPAFAATDPSAAILRPFERLVISEVPGELLRRAYSVPANIRVFGPWSGSLKRSSDLLVLRDKN